MGNSNTSPKELVDTISAKYITQTNFIGLTKLNDKAYCNKLVDATSKLMKQRFNSKEVAAIHKATHEDKKDVVFVDDLLKEDVNNDCNALAHFYVKVAHLFAAIKSTISNPTNVCDNRIQKLEGQNAKGFPHITACESKSTSVPGIVELDKLYGTRNKQRDVDMFYETLSGESNPGYTRFSDIPLNDKTYDCKTDVKSAAVKFDIFREYAKHLNQMKRTAAMHQSKLIDIVHELFIREKGVIKVNPKLTNTRLNELVKRTRHIIYGMYLQCEQDYNEGLEIYEAILLKSQLDDAVEMEKEQQDVVEEEVNRIIKRKSGKTNVDLKNRVLQKKLVAKKTKHVVDNSAIEREIEIEKEKAERERVAREKNAAEERVAREKAENERKRVAKKEQTAAYKRQQEKEIQKQVDSAIEQIAKFCVEKPNCFQMLQNDKGNVTKSSIREKLLLTERIDISKQAIEGVFTRRGITRDMSLGEFNNLFLPSKPVISTVVDDLKKKNQGVTREAATREAATREAATREAATREAATREETKGEETHDVEIQEAKDASLDANDAYMKNAVINAIRTYFEECQGQCEDYFGDVNNINRSELERVLQDTNKDLVDGVVEKIFDIVGPSKKTITLQELREFNDKNPDAAIEGYADKHTDELTRRLFSLPSLANRPENSSGV
jgi:hypothetical protein